MKASVKYKVADQLAPNFVQLARLDRRVAFGIILNAPIKLRGAVTSLKNAFSEEDAYHITNLVLCRIGSNKIIEVHMDCDDDVNDEAPF